MIRAVFFDVDDTLVDLDTAARAAFTEVFGEAADYAEWVTLTQQWHARHPGELSWQRMLVGRTAAFLDLLGRHDDADAVEARRTSLLDASYRLFPDVTACLHTLRDAGLCLGVITNSEPVYQRRKLAAVGLADVFDVVVISGEIGASKPDAAIFAHACAALGVSADEALHVGDRLDLDALGAADAGLQGVWLDRRASAVAERRVGVVTSLAQLPRLVA